MRLSIFLPTYFNHEGHESRCISGHRLHRYTPIILPQRAPRTERSNHRIVFDAPQVKFGRICSKHVCALPYQTYPAVTTVPGDS